MAAAAFETRDFYLACFLRCAGYALIDLRAEGRRKIFVFRDRPTRRDDVLAFYGDGNRREPGVGRMQGRGVSARLAAAFTVAGSPLPSALVNK